MLIFRKYTRISFEDLVRSGKSNQRL